MVLRNCSDVLIELKDYAETRDAYWELVALYKEIFVEFYLDEKNEQIYQCCPDADIQCYRLTKGSPVWEEYKDSVPEGLEHITRHVAERIEDNWNDERILNSMENNGALC